MILDSTFSVSFLTPQFIYNSSSFKQFNFASKNIKTRKWAWEDKKKPIHSHTNLNTYPPKAAPDA